MITYGRAPDTVGDLPGLKLVRREKPVCLPDWRNVRSAQIDYLELMSAGAAITVIDKLKDSALPNNQKLNLATSSVWCFLRKIVRDYASEKSISEEKALQEREDLRVPIKILIKLANIDDWHGHYWPSHEFKDLVLGYKRDLLEIAALSAFTIAGDILHNRRSEKLISLAEVEPVIEKFMLKLSSWRYNYTPVSTREILETARSNFKPQLIILDGNKYSHNAEANLFDRLEKIQKERIITKPNGRRPGLLSVVPATEIKARYQDGAGHLIMLADKSLDCEARVLGFLELVDSQRHFPEELKTLLKGGQMPNADWAHAYIAVFAVSRDLHKKYGEILKVPPVEMLLKGASALAIPKHVDKMLLWSSATNPINRYLREKLRCHEWRGQMSDTDLQGRPVQRDAFVRNANAVYTANILFG